LENLVAEIRGTPGGLSDNRVAGVESARGGRANNSPPSGSTLAPQSAKTNAELPATPSLAGGLASAVASAIANTPPKVAPTPPQREDAAHNASEVLTKSAEPPAGESSPAESVLAQFQRAVAEGGTTRAEAPPQRKSRREQLAQISEQPFVRRAIELFDVQPGQFRYAPPEGESN